MKEPVFLIGFMAAGKTSIGKLLSKVLAVPFQDVDQLIEQKENLTVDVIFEEYGDSYFRDLEAEMVLSHDFGKSVVSTGGGLPCFNDNMSKLLVQGTVIYLKASVDTITSRLLKTNLAERPLLKDVALDELANSIKLKLQERDFYYEQSNYTIITDDKTEDQIVSEITGLLS